MRHLISALVFIAVLLYTKSAAGTPPPAQLPCQKFSILGRSHNLCWTFDDHPSKHTLSILKLLRQHKIKATFFVVGWPLYFYTQYPQDKRTIRYHRWFQAILTDQHVVGNHSLTHADLCKKSRRVIRRELKRTQYYIQRYGKVTPVLWRAPFMSLCRKVHRVARALKLTHVSCHVQDLGWSAWRMWRQLRVRVQHGKKYSIILVHFDHNKLRKFLQLIKKHP